jgi:hypothetical protein
MRIYPREEWDGEKMSRASVRGDPHRDFFCRGDEDGELKPDEEFPIDITSKVRHSCGK